MQHWWDNLVAWSGGDWGHWVGAAALVIGGWVARNVPVRSGITAFVARFEAFELRYERDEQLRDARYRAGELRHTEVTARLEAIMARLDAVNGAYRNGDTH